MNLSIIQRNSLYGISNNNIEDVVPCTHENPLNAIDEWKTFETLNASGNQFLRHTLTLEEINEQEKLLQQQIK